MHKMLVRDGDFLFGIPEEDEKQVHFHDVAWIFRRHTASSINVEVRNKPLGRV